jgi:peptide/nickel transport system permease protein
MSTPVSPQRSPSPDDRNKRLAGSLIPDRQNLQSASTAAGSVSVNVVSPVPGEGASSPTALRLLDLWRLFTGNRKSLVGLCIVLLFVLVAIIGPLFVHHDPNAFSSDTLVPPSAQHWLGTTQTGQDVFSQLMVGTRVSIFWGFLTGIVVMILVVVMGLSAGYFGGVVDDILSLIINIFLVLPGLPLAIVLAAFVPFRGPVTVAAVIAITSWAYGARTLRAQTLSMRNRDFVDAARSSGESAFRIIFFEIFPNEISIVAASFIGAVIYVILAAAALEFLGLGDSTAVDWGTMLYWAQNNDALLLGAWWWFVPPGLCIAVLGAGLTFINFGMDEVANPRLRLAPQLRKIKKMLSSGKAVA